jgi:hypothetical protein
VDHELHLLVDGKRDEFEHVAGGVRTEMQETLVIEAGDDKCEVDCVEDVVISDPMLRAVWWISWCIIVSRKSGPDGAAEVVEGVGELLLERGEQVAIEVEGHADVAVAEALLDGLGAGAEADEQRRARVAQVAGADLRREPRCLERRDDHPLAEAVPVGPSAGSCWLPKTQSSDSRGRPSFSARSARWAAPSSITTRGMGTVRIS